MGGVRPLKIGMFKKKNWEISTALLPNLHPPRPRADLWYLFSGPGTPEVSNKSGSIDFLIGSDL